MKPTITLITLLLAICSMSAQIFVKQDATGNGTSWEDATSLINALQIVDHQSVWVAKGTYFPTETNNRNISFEVKSGIKVYGGFNGTETSRKERNLDANLTILSGEIGQPGIADNSYNVIYIKGASEHTVVDGFTITAGNASGDTKDGGRIRCGGGLYNDGSETVSKPIFANCNFKNNRGRDGAAVYNNGRGGESSPVFVHCTFQDNEADLDGGAMYNDGRNKGASKPTFKNCTFKTNMATYGGAIFNATEEGICNLYLRNCSFVENSAFLRGGAVFNMSGDNKCTLELLDCTFAGNYPDDQSKVTTSTSTRTNSYQINRP